MLHKIPKTLILTVLLTGCATINCKKTVDNINLPSMPIAGQKVAIELEKVCNKEKCPNITAWLNKLYIFRMQYLIYQKELKK